MKRLSLALSLVALGGLLTSAAAPRAHACSCAALTAAEAVRQADIVAIGKVIRLTTEEAGGQPPDEDAMVLVERYLKGDGPREIAVDDPPSSASCGIFDAGSLSKRYLLFLTGETSPFQTNLCSRTTELAGDRSGRRLRRRPPRRFRVRPAPSYHRRRLGGARPCLFPKPRPP